MKNFLLVEHGGKLKDFTLKTALEKDLRLFLVTNTVEDWLFSYLKKEDVIVVGYMGTVTIVWRNMWCSV